MKAEDFLMCEVKKLISHLSLVVLIGLMMSVLTLYSCARRQERAIETPVKVVEIKPTEKGIWLVQEGAVAKKLDSPFLTRLKYLRAERIKVTIVKQTGKDVFIRSNDLRADDLLVLNPESVAERQAVVPVEGLTDERSIRLVVEAGMAAGMAKNLEETMRFLSPQYSDSLGFNRSLMQQLLKRAYKEFNEPKIELKPYIVQVKDRKAVVEAKVRLSAKYRGRQNYLLGDKDIPNNVRIGMENSVNGWKVSWVEGLKPLGFEEEFLRFLGAEVGLSLSTDEQQKKQQYCMPCRQRMAERFGPWQKEIKKQEIEKFILCEPKRG